MLFEDGHAGVGGVTVSMVAFQAVDPGSIPGRRIFINNCLFIHAILVEFGAIALGHLTNVWEPSYSQSVHVWS